jgi:DNA-binding beta-propeller fold protein YncE
MRVLLPLAAALALAVAAAPAAAHHGVRVKTIATGLDNPRHVAVTHHGDVYVAEAGRGGDPATSKSCFNSAEGFACTGATGAVTKISSHRHQERVLTGLASFAPESGESAIGPHGVFASGGKVYVTNGGPTAPWRGDDQTATVLRDPTLVAEEPISRLYGTLLELGRHQRFDVVADLWRFERDNNPDGQVGNPLIDSNPVDVAAARGKLLVADAGGNTVLEVSKRGRVRVLSLFPNVPTPGPDGTIVPMNAVPTGVVAGPRGAYYMSQLTGFPFPLGGAKIFKIDPRTGAYTTYASGFTNVMDLDFGRDGTLYVLEIDHDSLLGASTDGAIFAVPPGGGTPRQLQLPAGTLTAPGGLAVAGKRTLVVSNHGREAGEGEVLEISW